MEKRFSDFFVQSDIFSGSWNPNTNTPNLSSTPTSADTGKYYKVSADVTGFTVTTRSATNNDYELPITGGNLIGFYSVTGAGVPDNTYGICGNGYIDLRNITTNYVTYVTIPSGVALTLTPMFAGIANIKKGDFIWCNGTGWELRRMLPVATTAQVQEVQFSTNNSNRQFTFALTSPITLTKIGIGQSINVQSYTYQVNKFDGANWIYGTVRTSLSDAITDINALTADNYLKIAQITFTVVPYVTANPATGIFNYTR